MEIKYVSGVSIVPIKKANRERMGGDKEGKEKEGGEQRRGALMLSYPMVEHGRQIR